MLRNRWLKLTLGSLSIFIKHTYIYRYPKRYKIKAPTFTGKKKIKTQGTYEVF